MSLSEQIHCFLNLTFQKGGLIDGEFICLHKLLCLLCAIHRSISQRATGVQPFIPLFKPVNPSNPQCKLCVCVCVADSPHVLLYACEAQAMRFNSLQTSGVAAQTGRCDHTVFILIPLSLFQASHPLCVPGGWGGLSQGPHAGTYTVTLALKI